MGKYLSYRERQDIEALYRVGTPVKQIALYLKRCYSTVYKELKRGRVKLRGYEYEDVYSYSAAVAQERFLQAQTSKGCSIKLGRDKAFADYIEWKILSDRFSPAAALAAARRRGFETKICVSTLYSYIDKGYFLHLSNSNLPCKPYNKKRVYHQVHRHSNFLLPHIEDRPDYVSTRQELGHWEMDCVCGPSGSRPVLLVLTERVTRYEMIFRMPDKSASSVVMTLNRIERAYPDFKERFKTITVDNGKEFSDYAGMIRSNRKGMRTQIFYCHPYTSCERGSNENCNRIIRRWVPKGSDIGSLSDRKVREIQEWINDYPRKILGYDSASDCMKVWLSA